MVSYELTIIGFVVTENKILKSKMVLYIKKKKALIFKLENDVFPMSYECLAVKGCKKSDL